MKKFAALLILFAFGCAGHDLTRTGSATGLGESPFTTWGAFTAAHANAMANAIDDNDGRITTIESWLAADIVALWDTGLCSGYLRSDGTCDSGDDLGSAAAADVVALWGSGSCSGLLQDDGTCIAPDDIPMVYEGANYEESDATLAGHLEGISNKLLDLESDPLQITLAPADKSVQGGMRMDGGVAGAALAQFALVYKKNDGKYYAYDANGADIANWPVPLAMTTTSAAEANATVNLITGVFFLKDSDQAQSFSTVGSVPIYASTTPGEYGPTAPSGNSEKVIIVGHLFGTDRYIMSLPAMVDIETPAAE